MKTSQICGREPPQICEPLIVLGHVPKASAKIRKHISAYAVSGQKSFKECLLDNRERAQLVSELKAVMDEKTDRIHFFELDPRRLAAAVGKVRRSSIDPFLIL